MWGKHRWEDSHAPVALNPDGAGCSKDSSEEANQEALVELAEVSLLFIGNQTWCLGRLEF